MKLGGRDCRRQRAGKVVVGLIEGEGDARWRREIWSGTGA